MEWAGRTWGGLVGWLEDKRPGRDVLVVVGVLAVASGAENLWPGAGRLVFGALVLYVALWHGPVVARILRSPQKE